MKSIAVIDYGISNLHSVAKALEYVAPRTRVWLTSDAAKIRVADRVLLPGVGAIRHCMAAIRRLGVDAIVAEVIDHKPLLGICVGLQALVQHSTENGGIDCMGHLPGVAHCFSDHFGPAQADLKVPHMGWNQVVQQPHPLWQGIADQSRFYFVHSYFLQSSPSQMVAGHCHYGFDFAAALVSGNIFAVQFHPEKSQRAGLTLLNNFLNWDGS
jgi:glutamine amidotransferase